MQKSPSYLPPQFAVQELCRNFFAYARELCQNFFPYEDLSSRLIWWAGRVPYPLLVLVKLCAMVVVGQRSGRSFGHYHYQTRCEG
jgi:hypothetical protein